MQEAFHQYSLIRELAKKHSHSTYLASPTHTQRTHGEPDHQVVLTAFSTSLFHSPHECENLLQKVRRLKELEHPHLAPILDMGIEEEQPFVVRQYLPNGSLRDHLQQLSPGRLELQDALTLVLQVGEALAYAHKHNIIHGNIKPENILFDAHDQVVLTDFHLFPNKDALIRDQIFEEYAFCYLAPEQLSGTRNVRSDQYALGCLTYELVTGRVPFAARSLASMMGLSSNVPLIPLSESVSNVPSFLETAVQRALSNNPAERFFDLSLFLGAIKSVLSSPPVFSLTNAVSSKLQSTELSGASSRAEAEGGEQIVAPLSTEVSMPEWAGIIPVSESLETAFQHDQLTPAFLQDAATLDSEENQEIIDFFEQEEVDVSSEVASAVSSDEYSESTVSEEILPMAKSSKMAVPRTIMPLPSKRRVFKLALIFSVIIAVICAALWRSIMSTPEISLPTAKKIIPAVATHITRVPATQSSGPITNTAMVVRSTQAAAMPTDSPVVHSTTIPTAQSPTATTISSPTSTAISGPTSYEAEASQNTLEGGSGVFSCSWCSGGYRVGDLGTRVKNGTNINGTLQFNNVNEQSAGNYKLTIYYSEGTADQSLYMSVDGGSAISLTAPGLSAGNQVGAFSVTITLNAGNNTIKFSNPSHSAPDIDRIVV